MKASHSALALVAGCLLASSVFAQCTNDTTLTATGSFAGNTCGKNLALTSFCSGGDVPNGAGTSVVQLNVGNSANITIGVVSSTTGFNPELAYTTGACSSLSACTVDDTNNTQTVGPDTPTTQPAAGTTFIFISDLNAESPGCGNYNLTVGGTLPVKLQNFSVQ
ncbi:MAG: hypothetical protein P4L92_15250 [Rudaea sp.]|nr:hypothetical protein [Rudaea sp.]